MFEIDGVEVLYPPEILTVGSAQEMLQRVSQCQANGIQTIVIDLQKVSWIDSSGLGILLSLYTKIRAIGGEIYLCSPNQQARFLFALTDMNRVFEIFDNREAFYAAKIGDDRTSAPCSAGSSTSDRLPT